MAHTLKSAGGDILLTEATHRTLGESWRMRSGRDRWVFAAEAIVAKMMPVRVRNRLLQPNQQHGYERIGAGCGQIALVHVDNPDQVVKIDRKTFMIPASEYDQRIEAMEQAMEGSASVVGKEFIPPHTIGVVKNPLNFGPKEVIATLQARIYGARDALQQSPEELEALAPAVQAEAQRFKTRVEAGLAAESPYVPDLFGPSNVVFGTTTQQPGSTWLIDNEGLERDFLQADTRVAGEPNMVTYLERLSGLDPLSDFPTV